MGEQSKRITVKPKPNSNPEFEVTRFYATHTTLYHVISINVKFSTTAHSHCLTNTENIMRLTFGKSFMRTTVTTRKGFTRLHECTGIKPWM
jgi:hypothetical protein